MYQVKDMEDQSILFETNDIYEAAAKKREYIILGYLAYIHKV